jgi:hypothetical protein
MLISLMLKVKLLNAAASAYHPNMVGEEQTGEWNATLCK